jgi:LDH2 family malate/lactate/ureidoglycolate dehydrogenase
MTIIPGYPLDDGQEQRVPVEPLRQWVKDVLVDEAMIPVEAAAGADRLIEADLRGIPSHGTRALPRYLEAMQAGSIDPRAMILTERDTRAMAVLHAGKGLGHVAATRAMELAIAKAKDVGTGTVAVRASQHFGAAQVYSMMAAAEGMIGYATTSTGPATVTAYGSRTPAVANNAFSWAAPTRNGHPVVLDMACAVSSWGKVHSMGMYGQPIPEGWAVDEQGNPTTNAKDATTLLPAAGPRGYGLAFFSSVLCGPLVGARMPLKKTWNIANDGSEHFMYAIDIKAFVEPDEYYDQIEATVCEIRQLDPAEGFDQVCLPGDLEAERELAWRADGLPMHLDQIESLQQVAQAKGIPGPWTLDQ